MYIYKIYKEGDENFYIGCTVDFHKRFINHKKCCNNPDTRQHYIKLYKHIRANGGWDSWNMVIIDECDSSIKEIELIQEHKPRLNTMMYDADINKERERLRGVEYRKKNKQKLADLKGRKCLCVCGSTYTHAHQSRHNRSKKHQNYINKD